MSNLQVYLLCDRATLILIRFSFKSNFCFSLEKGYCSTVMKSNFGVNVYEGGVADMSKSKVLEPSRVVEQAIQSASETAVMILRIDDVISSRGVSPEGAADFDGMEM